ncbi:MAG: PQQ-dependent sugar dehydrogenase [Candidatus Limnocylindrales bacterium]
MSRIRISTFRTAFLAALAAWATLTTPIPVAAGAVFPMSFVAGGFNQPVFLTHAGDGRLFVVQQDGLIKIVGVGVFLDVSTLIATGGGEQGLLGLAFHPNYPSNGLFYINYTRSSDGATVIAEYHRSNANFDVADPSSGRTVLTLSQPFANHNGGWMAFKGSNLYISTGDGGSGGDPGDRAQSKKALLGKILRINPLDPDGPNGAQKYSIPDGNPYVGRKGLDEIWSRGLRNPWRCSFDRVNGQMWCGDVGQGLYEEVDRVKTGNNVNFGWRLLEGRHYYTYPGRTAGDLCTSGCQKVPIAEYAHSVPNEEGNSAVTGGYVSRRQGAALYGKYVFGDFGSGRIWVIPSNFQGGSPLPPPVVNTNMLISSFGEDVSGFIYLVDYSGSIYRLDQS